MIKEEEFAEYCANLARGLEYMATSLDSKITMYNNPASYFSDAAYIAEHSLYEKDK